MKRLLTLSAILLLLAWPAVARATSGPDTAQPADYLAAAALVTVTDAGTIPADASPTGQAETLQCVVCSGGGAIPGTIVSTGGTKKTPAHNTWAKCWQTVGWQIKGTNSWAMWYDTAKYWESKDKKGGAHRVTYAAMTDHSGHVNAAWELLGWQYQGDSCKAWTLEDWNGHANGQHYSKYVATFICRPADIVTIATKTCASCMACHYNDTWSNAGSG